MTPKAKSVFVLAGIVLAALVVWVAGVARERSLPASAHIVPLGREIQYDDFAFAVLGTSEQDAIGDVRANGSFVLVEIRVANHAKRVGFRFKPRSFKLVADDGRGFSLSSAGQAALRAQEADGCAIEIRPGEACTTRLVFDVPPEATGLRARYTSNFTLFTMIDRIVYGNRVLDLGQRD